MYVSNRKEVDKQLAEARETTLLALGIQLLKWAVYEITEMGAVDTGNLRDHIEHMETDRSAIVGTNVNYAIYVDKGTKKMPKRPFISIIKTKYMAQIRSLINKTWEKETK